MKKLLSLALAAAMMLSLAACGASADTAAPAADDAAGTSDAADTADAPDTAADDAAEPAAAKRVAVVQWVKHASLDMICDAIVAELEARGLAYEVFNCNADAAQTDQIAAQVLSDGFDAIIPIATPAAVPIVNRAESKVPVIYAAISYPETANLTDTENVTGTSDALDTELVMQMMQAMDPDLSKVGLLYSNSEDSSEVPIADAKAYLENAGITYYEATASLGSEIPDAVAALVADGVQAVFTPTDNTIMTQAAFVGEELAKAGILYYAGADTFAMAGGFAGVSVDYVDLGTVTADITADALESGTVPADYTILPSGNVYVNTEVAEQLNVDPTPLQALAATYQEVTTSISDEA